MSATKKVGGRVNSLAVTRDEDTFKVEWKNPAYMFDESRADHATFLDSNIYFTTNASNTASCQIWDPDASQAPTGAKHYDETGYDNYWVKGLGTKTSYEKPFDPDRYHPVKNGTYLTGVVVGVHGGNDSGVGGWDPDDRQAMGRGSDATAVYNLKVPQAPALGIPEWDSDENYTFNIEINANPGKISEDKDPQYRTDTRYRILRQDNLSGSGFSNRKAVVDWTSFTTEEADVSYQASDSIQSLSDGEWVDYTIEAYSRGVAGDSSHVTKRMLASRPKKGVINSIKVSSLADDGIITANVTVGSDDHRWTTHAKLQRAKNVDPSWNAQRVAQDGTWEDVSGMVQISENLKNATWTRGFTDTVLAAKPTGANKRTWYRVVTDNDLYYDNNAYYSTPVEATQLYKAETAANAQIHIESLSTNADATAVKVRLGWPNDSGSTRTDGTEVSWSVHEDAWESSEQPSTALVTWKDATSQGSYANSASFTIYGVEQGQEIYVKARRYRNDSTDDTKIAEYGPYATASATQYPFIPAKPPTDVKLIAPSFVARGADVPLSWTFQSDAQQTAWAVYIVTTSNGSITSRRGVASGDDAIGACTVPASELSGDSVQLVVSMTTGSEWAESDMATVTFADAPVVQAALPSSQAEDELPVIMEQPVVIYCSSDTGDDLLRVRVVSRGVTVDLPDGPVSQLAGDAVFDAYVAPEWGLSGNSYYTAVVLPEGLELYDVGLYDFEVTGVNELTGMQSETQTITGRIRWAHQAHQPGSTSSVTTYDSDRVAVITPTAPDNAVSTDVFDLYRATPDGADLIAEGLPFGSAVSDRHAPYGTANVYRVCTRTKDGDVSWRDVEYSIGCKTLRLDWGSEHIELPYNIVREDSYAKDFEERKHLDGSVGGAWNPAVSKTASLSTDMVKLGTAEEQRLVRSLAQYAGPVFVRLPNGSAYQADVQVSGMSESYSSGAVSVSLSATKVDLTDEFRVSTSEITYADVQQDTANYKRELLYWGSTAPHAGSTYQLFSDAESVVVKLSTSYDTYTNEWTLTTSLSGRTVTLGSFSSELTAYMSEAAGEGTLYMVTAYIEAEEGESA